MIDSAQFDREVDANLAISPLSSGLDLLGMETDLNNALEISELMDSIHISQSKDPKCLLQATCVSTKYPASQMADYVTYLYEDRVRYRSYSITSLTIEGQKLTLRFCTKGSSLLVTGEITVTCHPAPAM